MMGRRRDFDSGWTVEAAREKMDEKKKGVVRVRRFFGDLAGGEK